MNTAFTSPQVSPVCQRSFLFCAKVEIQSEIVSLMLCGATWLSSSSIQPMECTGKLKTCPKIGKHSKLNNSYTPMSDQHVNKLSGRKIMR